MRHELYITHPVHCTCSLSLFPLPSRLSNWSRKTKEQKLSRHVFTRDLNSILVNKRDRLPFPPAHSQSHAPSRKTLIRSSLKRDRLPFSLGRLSHRQKSRGTKKITVYSACKRVYVSSLDSVYLPSKTIDFMIHAGERKRAGCPRGLWDDEGETILTRRGKKRLKHCRL